MVNLILLLLAMCGIHFCILSGRAEMASDFFSAFSDNKRKRARESIGANENEIFSVSEGICGLENPRPRLNDVD